MTANERGTTHRTRRQTTCAPLVVLALTAAAQHGLAAERTQLSLQVQNHAGSRATEVAVRVEASDGAVSKTILGLASTPEHVTLTGRAPWTLAIESDRLWAAPLSVSSAPTEPLTWEVWPAGRLTASLLLPDPRARAKTAAVRLLAAGPQLSQPHDVVVLCSVSQTNQLDCNAPVGQWRARLTVPGYAAWLFPKLEMLAGGKATLGRVELHPGASVSGTLEPSDEALTAKVVLAPLEPAAGLPVAPPSKDPLKILEVVPDQWGRFRFSELARGSYQLAVKVAACAPAATRLSVAEGEDLDLAEPLPTGCGSTLTVRVTRPELLPETGWDVTVYGVGPATAGPPIAKGLLRGTDGWRSMPLPSGDYRVWLDDGRDTSIGRVDVTLRPPGQEVTIPLDGFMAAGRAFLGDRPFACDLTFDNGPSGSRRKVTTDEDGRFKAFFPRPGRWRVGLAGDATGRRIHSQNLQEVDIRPDTEVEIHFPDTEFSGKVLSSAGAPVADALVTLFPPDFGKLCQLRSDEDGTFTIQGLTVGRWQVQAKKEKATSRMQQVDIVEAQTSRTVVTLKDEGSVTVRVTSEAGPVPGTTIFQVPLGPRPLALLPLPPVVTGLDGTAIVSVPPGSVGLRIYALAAGFSPRRQIVAPLPDQEEVVEVRLGNASGLLRLPASTVQALAFDTPTGRRVPILFQDGEPVPNWVLQTWVSVLGAQRQGAFLVLPLAPPGTYFLCTPTMDEGEAILEELALPAFARCTNGVLGPGGLISLDLPPSDAKPAAVPTGR